MKTSTIVFRKPLYLGSYVLILLIPLLAACGGSTPSANIPGPAPTLTPTTSSQPVSDTPPTPVAHSKPGPQDCPAAVKAPSYWDALLATSGTSTKVEQVTCAVMTDDPSLQALVTVRHTDAKESLDLYIYKNITNQHPQQLFSLSNLIKGAARIDQYSTLLTAEVDANSTLNSGVALSGMTPDLFREFAWSTSHKTFVQIAFPGIFPDLTRYQAEADQTSVGQGKDLWKNDAMLSAKALVTKLFNWQRSISASVVKGGTATDSQATVNVSEAPADKQTQGPSVVVSLSRLEGNLKNIWIVVAVRASSSLSLVSPAPLMVTSSPLQIEATGNGGKSVQAQAVVYDHVYNVIGHAPATITTNQGVSSYTAHVPYTSSFQTGTQEGITAFYLQDHNEKIAAILQKELLSAKATVSLGPLPCPDAVSSPSYWDALLPVARGSAKTESVSCGNLTGTPALQALVVARFLNNGLLMRGAYVFDTITNTQPKLLFKQEGLYKGDARISAYSSITTAMVDTHSSLNKGKSDADAQIDLFREFTWNSRTGGFTQVAFPGIFPDLTRYQAEADQKAVSSGHDAWKNDAAQTAQAMAAQLLHWTGTIPTQIVSGNVPGDTSATVELTKPGRQSSDKLKVTLKRLEGGTKNIWIVTTVDAESPLSIITPPSLALTSSPVTLQGNGGAFSTMTGQAFVFDHLYTVIGQADVSQSPGMGNAPSYSVKIPYGSTFQGGIQEGLLALYAYHQNDPSVATATLQKVLLGA